MKSGPTKMTHDVPFPKVLQDTTDVELDAERTKSNPGTLKE